MYGELALCNLLDGQTGSVHGNALALLYAFIGRLYTQFYAVLHAVLHVFFHAVFHAVHAPYVVYDSGKHSRRSNTNNVSEPNGRRSTTIQRGASASGNARTPGKTESRARPRLTPAVIGGKGPSATVRARRTACPRVVGTCLVRTRPLTVHMPGCHA